MSDQNPFAALIQKEEKKANNESNEENNTSLNNFLETVFAFTLNSKEADKKGYIYLGNEKESLGYEQLDLTNLSYCLFERLFSCTKDTISNEYIKENCESHSNEQRVITYLYICYRRYLEEVQTCNLDSELPCKVKEEILKSAGTAYIHPDIYFEQNLFQQLIDILVEELPYCLEFFTDLCHTIVNHDESDELTLQTIFQGLIAQFTSDILKIPLSTFDTKYLSVLNVFVKKEEFASLFMKCIQPKKPESGMNYAVTLLGSLININILPKTPNAGYEHFQNMLSPATIEATENILWGKTKIITDQIHHFVLSLLKCSPKVKEEILNWIGQCLKCNSDREKLWNNQLSPDFFPATYSSVPDGFMIQLGNILLKLAQPICRDTKILKVDPTYCAIPDDMLSEKHIHLPNMSTQTCLLPVDDGEERSMAESYNFSTECFFCAHRAIHLGFAVAVDKAVRINHELGRIERAYNEARQQSVGNTDVMDNLKDRLTNEMSKFLSYKAQLSEPYMLSCMFEFVSSTSFWLCQIVLHQDSDNKQNYAPMNEIPLSFPVPNKITNVLKYIPEFLISNIVCFIVYIMRFSPKDFEIQGSEKLEPILSFIVMFMGNHKIIKNPHLRAQLAEALEALLPVHKEELGPRNDPVNFQRTALFSNYKFKRQVVESLLEVFVGIEMTGQSVEFEQKFNYRRPMYGVMEYLWDQEEYAVYFVELACEAENNMEAVSPPIFLRFINLLINDAVFLLDESLTNMAKLREMQAARDSGEWEKLPARERTQNLSFLHHTGMIARFDNILGRDTITALEKLTSRIQIVFTHSTMVDRIAAMLNYFLLNLVGPNKKNFKVKDHKEYHFDPAETVLKISKIYINLKENDSFCLAVSQDGRSYSPNLFSQAESVLVRIGGTSFVHEMQELAQKVSEKATELRANEEAMAEAPDHFLDPIMSTLMTDPVILPSSKQVVDRTTIARHLLSDQTDPFNRSPLSMDQVVPHTELLQEIKSWLAERQSR